MTSQIIPGSVQPQPEFLPASRLEMDRLGWPALDILLVQGDAHLDHPAQGPALLGRWLVAHGFKVGLISQPRWRDPEEAKTDFSAMGRPRLFLAISAGSMDSMLAHYTAFRKKRSDDALTPGGKSGARPNRATLVYTGLARAVFPGLPILIGGLEASLRRASHYDFWEDGLRRSVLLESKADLLVYGPGERPLLEAALRLASGGGAAPGARGEPDFGLLLTAIPGTVTPRRSDQRPDLDLVELPGHEDILADPRLLMTATLEMETLIHQGQKAAWQVSGRRAIWHNPPAAPLSSAELDFIYGLPFSRRAHPSYLAPIPALSMLATSLTTHRGCGGGCSFCSLALHQGRRVVSRSIGSIAAEAAGLLTGPPGAGGGFPAQPQFKVRERGQQGRAARPVALSDVGAATANLWGAKCLGTIGKCLRRSCLWPQPCSYFKADQQGWLNMLNRLKSIPGIKQVRVASGVRYDLLLANNDLLGEFLNNFVGGQLKVAPEHLDPDLLRLMRKPGPECFERFLGLFKGEMAKGRYLVPYLISAFPGSDSRRMRSLADWLRGRHWRPRQVQAFIPTPGTVATAMFFAGVDENGQPLPVARSDRERLSQHAFLTPLSRPEDAGKFSGPKRGPRNR